MAMSEDPDDSAPDDSAPDHTAPPDDELAVDPDDPHVLSPEELVYPELAFEDGDIGADGAFDLSAELDRDELAAWLEDLAGALTSHDLAVESPDGHVTFGIAPVGMDASFDPDEDLVGELAFTVKLRAKPMFVADDPEGVKVGSRGGKGFIPIEQLTTDRESFRCYNWIEDPTDSGNDSD